MHFSICIYKVQDFFPCVIIRIVLLSHARQSVIIKVRKLCGYNSLAGGVIMTGKLRVFILTVIAVFIWSAHSCVYADEVKSKIYLGIRQQETANGVTITVV